MESEAAPAVAPTGTARTGLAPGLAPATAALGPGVGPTLRARVSALPRMAARRAALLTTAPVALAAAAPIAIYLWVALHRVGYPFELDWMEGGSVELAGRVLAGHSLYAAPSVSFVGWTYPPLYYWVSAALARVIGLGFLPLRLVSLTASLVSMATLGWIVARESEDRIAGLVAAGLFAATFRISGAWFDTGRVDSLFLALTLITLAWGRWARGVRGGIGLGALAFLAFFTKQTAVLAVVPALVVLIATRRRVGVAAAVTLVALLVASTAVLQDATGGWYGYYIYSELVHQQVAQTLWLGFWRDDIWRQQWPLVILIVAGGAALAWLLRARPGPASTDRTAARPRPRQTGPPRPRQTAPPRPRQSQTAPPRPRHTGPRHPRPPLYYAAAATGLIGSAWVSRLHTGGYANVLMPAYAALALLAGLAYAALARLRGARPMLAAAVLVQLGLLVYPIGAQIPTAADRRAGAELIARLRALPGPVIVLRHPWYATLAGKGTFAQAEAIGDVLRSASTRGARPLRASLADALNADHVQAVVLDGTFDAHFFAPELARYFRLQPAPITASRLYPLTDVRTSPTLLYLRVRAAPER